jgi:hypothetical protein
MANVNFERSCQSCHSLDFDKRVKEQAPHVDSAAVLKFVQAKMAEVAPGDKAALIKAETILFRGKCLLCHSVANVDQLPRLTNADFETNAFGMRLNKINTSGSPDGNLSSAVLSGTDDFTIAPSHAPQRFFTAAMFSHSAHSAVECEECHANTKTSVSGTDLLMPGIAVCQRCHDGQSRPQGPALSSGHAESGCGLCHDYHETVALKDGREPTPKSTFPISQLTSK